MQSPALALYLTRLPFDFAHWWFIEAPVTILKILRFIFLAFVHLFSLKELFTTFFKPWKNEYREGLVRTAIVVGVVFKSMLIVLDVFLLSFVLLIEVALFALWISLPFLAVFSLYGAIFA
jgi:hypothetical protein